MKYLLVAAALVVAAPAFADQQSVERVTVDANLIELDNGNQYLVTRGDIKDFHIGDTVWTDGQIMINIDEGGKRVTVRQLY